MPQIIQFDELSQVHDRLIDDYKKGQAPQALLLSGISGLLKENFAEYLAQILLCSSLNHPKPCNQCSACRQVQKKQHPNLLYLQALDGAKSIKIEQLRSLLSTLSLNPIETGRRLIVIFNIDTMTVQAQNALLKSLEEPQKSDYYIITSNNEQHVIPTIISRCRFIRLLPWTEKQIYRLLVQNKLSPERATELSRFSQGRPGLALRLEDDQKYRNARELAVKSFFSVKKLTDIPSASSALKDAKENADILLNLLEQEVQTVLYTKYLEKPNYPKGYWSGASDTAVKGILQAIIEARKYKSSNVSWQSIADRLLFSIIKEIY